MKSIHLTLTGSALLFFLGTTNLAKIHTNSVSAPLVVNGAVTMNQSTPLINIQGTFKDSDGFAIADGDQTVTFRLYHQEAGGTALWEETAQVYVKGGLYSHNLGSVTPLNPDIFSTAIYLGVETNGFELTPRGMMTYSPYSLFVNFAGTAGKADTADHAVYAASAGQATSATSATTAGNGVPAGTVLAFAGTADKLPNGFLLCNGQDFNKNTYPDLYAVIGNLYGGSGDIGKVPDYRNMFLRGNPASGRNLGTFQGYATARPGNAFTGGTDTQGEHSHTYRRTDDDVDQNLGFERSNNDGKQYDAQTSAAGAHSHSVTITGGGDSETRPENYSVHYIIKT